MTCGACIFECPICDKRTEFRSFAGRHAVRCSECGSLERHRSIALWLKRHMRTGPTKVLHIAPEPCLVQLLKSYPNVEYVSADAASKKADVQDDMQASHFESETFDLIVCSHVLEHIPDDRKALREMHRVLKPHGTAVIMVPIKQGVNTVDTVLHSPRERRRQYGQHDHVRMYGSLDVMSRLASGGFMVHPDDTAKTQSTKYGLAIDDVVYALEKSAAPWEPVVTAICSTYKRPTELEESIACFLSQDYPHKEMIILDDAGQYSRAAIDLPGVKLITSSHRFLTMGEKRNASAALASPASEVYAVWDDDDIYLPHHLSVGVQALEHADYSIPKNLLIDKKTHLQRKVNNGMFHGAWMFKREAFMRVGGYPWIQSGQDVGLLARFKEAQLVRGEPDEATYIYRWFTAPSRWHLSAGPGYEALESKPVYLVDAINPHFSRDWGALDVR